MGRAKNAKQPSTLPTRNKQRKLYFVAALACALQGLHSSRWEGDEGEKVLKSVL